MKILCFGDSNTYGFDPRSYFGSRYPAQHRWVDLLAQKLGCEAVNEGENGREIPVGDRSLRQFACVLSHQEPLDLLMIMLGSNDLLQGNEVEAIVKRMEAFVGHIALEKEKILLICPPPMQLGEWVSSKEQIDASVELSKQYQALALRLGVGFADAGKWNISLTYDGVHFTEEGHSAFAEGLLHHLIKSNQI